MKRLSLLLFVAIGASLLFKSCATGDSSDVNQDKIYTIYEAFYNKNSDKTWVSARFQFGGVTGTNLELDSTAYVLFNADTLPYNWLLGCHFKEYSGRISTGTFTYRNLNGVTYTNTLPTVDTLNYEATFDTIKKSVANTITWVGSPLAANESVSIFIGSWGWGQDALYATDADGATNLVLGTTTLSSLATGVSTCYMDRKKQTTVSSGTSVGGVIRTVYRPIDRIVTVIP